MKVECLGGFREVGRNAVLLDSKEKIMLDFGLNVEDTEPPVMPKRVDYCLLAHAHLDHVGCIPMLNKFNCPVYSTAATFDQAHLLLKDSLKVARLKGHPLLFSESDVEKIKRKEKLVTYGQMLDTKHAKIEIHNAGHVPGSIMYVVEIEGKRILYTSDFSLKDSRLLKGANIDELKDIDVLFTESTYASREHPPRDETEKKLYQIVSDTINCGGIALIPAFAVGRSAEILMALNSFRPKFKIYMDGMARAATEIYLQYPELIRNHKALSSALNKVDMITNNEQRKEAIKEPCAIITTGGCLDGGPAVQYIRNLWSRENNSLTFVGYQIPKTAGRYLLDTGRFVNEETDLKLKMRVNSLDFSAHADRNDLFKFINKIRPKKIVCMHGDQCQRFAQELRSRGFDAEAPKIGETINI
ncbi:MAG: MBL fold metallo-hydrolase RNA specificity domain-containing protein [Candidatus Aenigmarchaeota archaeon]|nr:MBL fold metallo-hydrolase RNA specificity domain-containing protein [Candidatus Aenigmarchaeota archaeon]